MTQAPEGSVIPDEVRARVGKPSEPYTVVVEKGAMIKCARSLDDLNPMFVDEEAAKKMRYGGLIAHASLFYYFLGSNRGRQEEVQIPVPPGWQSFHAGDEYEFYEPIRPGDIITSITKIADITERTTRSGGKQVLTTNQIDFWNQHNRKVGVRRVTSLRRPKPN